MPIDEDAELRDIQSKLLENMGLCQKGKEREGMLDYAEWNLRLMKELEELKLDYETLRKNYEYNEWQAELWELRFENAQAELERVRQQRDTANAILHDVIGILEGNFQEPNGAKEGKEID
jgi:hypothetical protein